MVKTFSAFTTNQLKYKVEKFQKNFPESSILHWKLSAKYLKKERCVKLSVRVEFSE